MHASIEQCFRSTALQTHKPSLAAPCRHNLPEVCAACHYFKKQQSHVFNKLRLSMSSSLHAAAGTFVDRMLFQSCFYSIPLHTCKYLYFKHCWQLMLHTITKPQPGIKSECFCAICAEFMLLLYMYKSMSASMSQKHSHASCLMLSLLHHTL